MAGDIQLRNPGATAGDINLDAGGATSASFAVAFSFTATGQDAPQVASLKVEAVAALGTDAEVASLRVEVVANLDEHPDVASVRVEAVGQRPLSPYQAATESTGGTASGICTPADLPTKGFAGSPSFCSGFDLPLCSGSGGSSQRVLLAFHKAAADEVLLCTRGAFTGLYPTTGLSIFSWARVTQYNGGSPGAVPYVGNSDATVGWLGRFAGTAAPDTVGITYRDTGTALREDTHATPSGDLRTAGWRAVGGFRGAVAPYTQRAFVDDEVGAGTDGTVAPEPGALDLVTLFGAPGGNVFTGRLLCPLVINADLGADGDTTYQDDFYADLGKRNTALFYNPNAVLSPRAKNTVRVGDAVQVWAVNSAGSEVSGPTVFGTPAYWRGPWWGLNFEDVHWIRVPWSSAALTTGKTVLLSVQGSSIPISDSYVAGRLGAGAGGFELFITGGGDGIDATLVLYDAAGGAVATIAVSGSGANLGSLVHYAIRIGAGGVASCSLDILDAHGNSLASGSAVPSAAVSLNQDQRWGREHAGGAPYVEGTCFRWAEAEGVLDAAELQELVAGTYATPSQDLRGVDGNVVDDADPVKLWGHYDPTGVYGSTIVFESIGGPEIVVGS